MSWLSHACIIFKSLEIPVLALSIEQLYLIFFISFFALCISNHQIYICKLIPYYRGRVQMWEFIPMEKKNGNIVSIKHRTKIQSCVTNQIMHFGSNRLVQQSLYARCKVVWTCFLPCSHKHKVQEVYVSLSIELHNAK